MKRRVTKKPKIALCRVCHGTGHIPTDSPNADPCICTQCEGSGRVTVSANMELDIRPYKPVNR